MRSPSTTLLVEGRATTGSASAAAVYSRKGRSLSFYLRRFALLLIIGYITTASWLSYYLHDGLTTVNVYDSSSLLSNFGGNAHRGNGPFVINKNMDLSIVILTYKKPKLLEKLLKSLQRQELEQVNFETIVVDNGCLPETKAVYGSYQSQASNRIYRYLAQCNNPGYAVGNNMGVKKLATGKWLLFLNDDVILQPGFLQQYFNLLASNHRNLAAIGCKLLNQEGTQVIEAGSIIWRDGSGAGYGRDRNDLNASDLSYPRPVDYVSGACLMIDHSLFQEYGGFDDKNFPNYCEDTDLQMHVQHNLGKEVWLQPQAVALHAEHGSFGAQDSIRRMQKAKVKFKAKWEKELVHHLPNPLLKILPGQETDSFYTGYLQASDLRARRKHSILYIDQALPNPFQASGFGRPYDTVQILSQDLGHMVTVTSIQKEDKKWCNKECRQSILKLGIEVVETGSKGALQSFMESRVGFYDVVLVSHPSTFSNIHDVLRKLYIMNRGRFAIIYDPECLWYRREEMMLDLMEDENMKFPGAPNGVSRESVQFERDQEISWIRMSDVIISVSASEACIMKILVEEKGKENGVTTFTIGPLISEAASSTPDPDFQNRSGILFLADFHHHMFYNGDAIWYFLEEIYPLILEKESIQLTVAGWNIPQQLFDFVEKHEEISKHVIFLDSPKRLEPLFKKTWLIIAPHLYIAGIQLKISEAWSFGVPAVMSLPVAESLGITPESNVGCVGQDAASFKDCVISIHKNETHWQFLRKNTLEFIGRNYASSTLVLTWAQALESATVTKKARTYKEDECEATKANCPDDLLGYLKKDYQAPTKTCPDGEEFYLSLYPDVAEAVHAGTLKSGFNHYQLYEYGREDSYRLFVCNSTKIGIWKQCTESCIVEGDETVLRHGIIVGEGTKL